MKHQYRSRGIRIIMVLIIASGGIAATKAALTITQGSLDFSVPTFKQIFFKAGGNEYGEAGVKLDGSGFYASSTAIPGTAGNVIKLNASQEVIRSLIGSNDITTGAITGAHIQNGGITAQDIGNLQVQGSDIHTTTLILSDFGSDVNFVSGGLYYTFNNACTSQQGITAVVNGTVTCVLPTGDEGESGIPDCDEGQTPVMSGGSRDCLATLLGDPDGDPYWNGLITGDISNDNLSGEVRIGIDAANVQTNLAQTATLHTVQDVTVDMNGGIGDVYCNATDTRVSGGDFSPDACAVCETEGYVYNSTTDLCEIVVCIPIGTGNDPIDGVCGTANGSGSLIPPTDNLCTVGTASIVSDNGVGYWARSCAGLNDGNTTSCTAAIITSTVCSTYNGFSCTDPNGYDTFSAGGTCQGYYQITGTSGTCVLGGNTCITDSQCTGVDRKASITPGNIQYVTGGYSYVLGPAWIEPAKNPVNVYNGNGILLGTCNFKEIISAADSQWVTQLGNGSIGGQTFAKGFFAKSFTSVGYNSTQDPSWCNAGGTSYQGYGWFGGCLGSIIGNNFTANLCVKSPSITESQFTSLISAGAGTLYMYGSGSNRQRRQKVGAYALPAGTFNTYVPPGGPQVVTDYTQLNTFPTPHMVWNGMMSTTSAYSADDCQGGTATQTYTGQYWCYEGAACASTGEIESISMISTIPGGSTFSSYQGGFYYGRGPSSDLCNGYNVSDVYHRAYKPTGLFLTEYGNQLLYGRNCGTTYCSYTRSNPRD